MYIDGLVSVIIPVYNSEKHIKECLESALAQSYSKIEIITIDDCSPDGSSLLIEQMTKAHNNILYFKLNENSGAAIARNKALELAHGRYVAFLDSDDLWKPDKLKKEINEIRQR